MKVNYLKKSIEIPVKNLNFFGKASGLMFKTRETSNLLFDFYKEGMWSIHSFFVFFNFLVLWLDDKNNVLEWQIVKPFTFYVKPSRKFVKLVEVPLNVKTAKIIDFFVEE